MPDHTAIRLSKVSKVYQLFGNQRDRVIDVLRLDRFGLRPSSKPQEFAALRDIDLEVPRGRRIGIVGRNGAGKTTLLKLICGNFAPSSGTVEVNGTVQALLTAGVGFHPDYTGRENIEGAMQYSGLSRAEHREAIDGIIDFCELGAFLDQPFKTYSLGMQARLMFAAATAIRPDILIVDEVLGAGDAYFVAKSKKRVQGLVRSGCTMLLVSHSMQQVLELCDEAIWLDQGSVRMRGEAFLVVKAYEQHLFGPISELAAADAPTAQAGEDPDSESAGPSRSSRPDAAIPMSEGRTGGVTPRSESSFQIQEPRFRPHAVEQSWSPPVPTAFTCIAPGGLSRWDGECGLKIIGFGVYAESGPTDRLVSMQPVKFVFTLESDRESDFECRYGIAIHDHLGACRTRIFSPCDAFSAVRGGLRSVVIVLNPCQLGPGEYTLGISVSRYAVLERINSAPRYDLLSRSFCFRVELPESLAALDSAFVHSAEWSFEAADA